MVDNAISMSHTKTFGEEQNHLKCFSIETKQ